MSAGIGLWVLARIHPFMHAILAFASYFQHKMALQ
jgi:hypothetical protein